LGNNAAHEISINYRNNKFMRVTLLHRMTVTDGETQDAERTTILRQQ